MTPHRQQSGSDRGFTLVEALVAVALLALAALIALPLAGNARRDLALRASAVALASELKSARASAMRVNREETVEIDAAQGTTRLGTTAGTRPIGAGWSGAAQGDGRGGPGITLTTIRGEQTGLASGRIRFYPDGSSTGGRIVLTDRGRTAIVTVDWLTGGARVDVDN